MLVQPSGLRLRKRTIVPGPAGTRACLVQLVLGIGQWHGARQLRGLWNPKPEQLFVFLAAGLEETEQLFGLQQTRLNKNPKRDNGGFCGFGGSPKPDPEALGNPEPDCPRHPASKSANLWVLRYMFYLFGSLWVVSLFSCVWASFEIPHLSVFVLLS